VLGGRYRLDRLIATGGMAQVWEATDEVLARRVAVKVLHPHLAADESFVARFRREAVAAARLSHPSIVSIYDTCADDDCQAIVMELVEGSTLRELLDERKWLEPGQAVTIIAEVADALETAHQGGVVHRDVKPANILLSPDGRVLVADFGIAKAGGDLTTTNTTLGTAKYLAPEQVEGKPVDARSDVYALGVVLYETLCGRPPFVAETEAATALARLHQEPMRPRNVRAGVPKALEDVVLHAMARDPDERYASAAAFRAALLAAGRGTAPGQPLSIAPPPPPHGDATVATSGPRPADHTPTGNPPTFVRTERGWLVPTVVIVLVALALIIVGVLVAGGGSVPVIGGGGGNNSPTATNAITLTGASAFDPPPGDGSENDADAPNAIDGDPNTLWQTQGYNDPAIKIKPGVGIYVTLAQAAKLKTLKVTSPTSGWAVQIYVADSKQPDLASWGQPVAQKDGISSGTVSLDLGGHQGAAVLIWITNVGTSPDDSGRFHTQIAEVSVGAN
jgi:serine/threonine-protein kinase